MTRWRAQLDDLLPVVPAPKARNRDRPHEVYTVVHLLRVLPDDALVFPVSLYRGERPDFRLDTPSGRIGIEVTEGIAEETARVRAELDNSESAPDWTPMATFHPGYEAPSEGWYDDEPEARAFEIISSQIAQKFRKANSYRGFDALWLAVYQNTHVPLLDLETPAGMLARELQSDAPVPFDRIFVVAERQTWQVWPVAEPFPKA